MHSKLEKLEGMDMEMYVISGDQPEEQQQLFKEMDDFFGKSLPFISDPDLQLIDKLGMKNGDVANRGYAILDSNGEVVLTKVNDHWGEEFDQTVKDIKEAYKEIEK